MQGWICIEGRPRQACAVQNLSEGGAQLSADNGPKLPGHFVLMVEALKLRVGCEKLRDADGLIGVRFLSEQEFAQAQALAKSPPSTYELLLAEASAEHRLAQEREEERKVPEFIRMAASS